MSFKFKFFILIIVFVFANFYYNSFRPILNFPVNKIFNIEKGESLHSILVNFKKEEFINNIFYAKLLSKFIKVNFQPGEYYFDYQPSLYQLLMSVNVKQNLYKLTIPEGLTKLQIAEKINELNLPYFDKKEFLEKAKEGQLFPDTYFFEKINTTEEIIQEIENNFERKINNKFSIWKSLDANKKQEIIIIASMLEREAKDLESMKIIAGIINNRLKANMPLQIDATVLYGKGIWKDRVYFHDLISKTENEKNYNTYDREGLPIGPISNPGINAIEAALYPTVNNYLYYLTGKDGTMHYAKIFSEHIKNRKYLKN